MEGMEKKGEEQDSKEQHLGAIQCKLALNSSDVLSVEV